MTKDTTRFSAPYQRRTLPLRGTCTRLEVKLDFPAKLAVEYARDWLNAGPGRMDLDVLASGVIRRSLKVYMERLAQPGLDAAQEARDVRSCCSSSTVDQEEQDAATGRLEGRDKGQPMPSYADVLNGPDCASRWADFDASHTQLMRIVAATPAGRLAGLKASDYGINPHKRPDTAKEKF